MHFEESMMETLYLGSIFLFWYEALPLAGLVAIDCRSLYGVAAGQIAFYYIIINYPDDHVGFRTFVSATQRSLLCQWL